MVMRKHQRYFPVEASGKGLLPHFITVANGNIDVPTVQAGTPSPFVRCTSAVSLSVDAPHPGVSPALEDSLDSERLTAAIAYTPLSAESWACPIQYQQR